MNKNSAAHAAVREHAPRPAAHKCCLADRLDDIADHCAALPVLRDRAFDEILGYEDMLPSTHSLQR